MPDVVVVESPAKSKTIQQYLGPDYIVLASYGHVRDLPKDRLAIDLDTFTPEYIVLDEKRGALKRIQSAIANARTLWLATDPDREGESIAWHILECLKSGARKLNVKRVTFHEITESAIKRAFSAPRQLDRNLIAAQQERRVLDRLVGYLISPILSEHIRVRGASAGRVQTPALRLVVERERAIRNFVPEEYWVITASLEAAGGRAFKARFVRAGDKPVKLKNKREADYAVNILNAASYKVGDVQKKNEPRRPPPPFTTSTLQQECSRWFGLPPEKTMQVAQKLYEGIDIDGKHIGLITYMRTDSVSVSREAQEEARRWIAEHLGEAYLPKSPPVYRNTSKNAQEAHEAIRPTSVYRTPKSIQHALDETSYQVYSLIWRRFVASQMSPAIYAVTRVDVEARSPLRPDVALWLESRGQQIVFDGFQKIYVSRDRAENSPQKPSPSSPEGEDDSDDERQEELDSQGILPPLSEGERLSLRALDAAQRFTTPPSRYTEAGLVKALERRGIGRPSTYAATLSALKLRGYVERKGKHLVPTELGEKALDFLLACFAPLFEYTFTADMEDRLDEIAKNGCTGVSPSRWVYEQIQRLQASLPPPPTDIPYRNAKSDAKESPKKRAPKASAKQPRASKACAARTKFKG